MCFLQLSESVSHAFVIRDVTYKKSRPTVKVVNVAVTLGMGLWLGWILHNEELRCLHSSVEFQEVPVQAVKV